MDIGEIRLTIGCVIALLLLVVLVYSLWYDRKNRIKLLNEIRTVLEDRRMLEYELHISKPETVILSESSKVSYFSETERIINRKKVGEELRRKLFEKLVKEGHIQLIETQVNSESSEMGENTMKLEVNIYTIPRTEPS